MGAFVADAAIKKMILAGKQVRDAKVVILGLTFKENCPDTRNSKVEDIINRLREYAIDPIVVDPWANEKDAMNEYGVRLTPLEMISEADCIILAVAHDEFKKMDICQIDKLFKNVNNDEKVLIDVKGIVNRKILDEAGYRYWRL